MTRPILALTLCAMALIALAPATMATPYNVCAPTNAVCVVQSDTPYGGPACNSYANAYGANSDKNEVNANVAGNTAAVGAQNLCANWFYGDYNYQGFYATGNAGGKTVNFGWYVYDLDYHWPGAPADSHGEYITLTVNDGSGPTGVTWMHRITPSAGTDTCDTTVYVQGSPTNLGCPAGAPPAPPAAPWGAILP